MSIEGAFHHDRTGSRDREVIHVDFHSDHFGITAALRRAFAEAANDHSDRDFEELLRQLN